MEICISILPNGYVDYRAMVLREIPIGDLGVWVVERKIEFCYKCDYFDIPLLLSELEF
jgi:hypothetical protein